MGMKLGVCSLPRDITSLLETGTGSPACVKGLGSSSSSPLSHTYHNFSPTPIIIIMSIRMGMGFRGDIRDKEGPPPT